MSMPVPRARRAGGARRTTVFDAVIRVLAERGYENTRFADVSAASGTAVSTLQNCFGSRVDMLIEAMRYATDQESAALEAVAESESDPWRRLVALIDRSLGSSEQDRQVLIELWRSGIRDEELRVHSEEEWKRYGAPFLKAVVEGVDQGVFRPVHPPEDIVDFLLAALAGFVIPRVLRHRAPSEAGFRSVLLSQLRAALGVDPR